MVCLGHGRQMEIVLGEATGRKRGPYLFVKGEDLEDIVKIFQLYIRGSLKALLVN
jgi:hypothetical protein